MYDGTIEIVEPDPKIATLDYSPTHHQTKHTLTFRWRADGGPSAEGYWLRIGTRPYRWDLYNGHGGKDQREDIEVCKLPYSNPATPSEPCRLYAQVSKRFKNADGEFEEMTSNIEEWTCPEAHPLEGAPEANAPDLSAPTVNVLGLKA